MANNKCCKAYNITKKKKKGNTEASLKYKERKDSLKYNEKSVSPLLNRHSLTDPLPNHSISNEVEEKEDEHSFLTVSSHLSPSNLQPYFYLLSSKTLIRSQINK